MDACRNIFKSGLWLLPGLWFLLQSSSANAESKAQFFHEGDSWIYSHIQQYNHWTENGQVADGSDSEYKISIAKWNPGSNLMYVEKSDSLFPDAPKAYKIHGGNWAEFLPLRNRLQPIDIPLSNPMFVGKKWNLIVQYSGDEARAEDIDYVYQINNYTVTGNETLTLDGIDYQTWKVEVNSDFTIANKRNDTKTRGSKYAIYWYAPQIKNYMKWQVEMYRENRTLKIRDTYTLKSFALSR